MPKLAANLTMLFTEYPFLERFDRAAQAGFRGVEFLFPYVEQPQVIIDALNRNSLELVLFNLPAGDWAAGDRGIAAQPDRQDEFRAGVEQAVRYARELKPPRINCLAGKSGGPNSREVLIENVRYAAEQLSSTGTRLLIEPVNDKDIAGFAVPTTQAALDLITDVDHENVELQFDIYHSLQMGEDPFALIEDLGDQIAHIQIADVPGRHQPGTGEIDFDRLFALIDGTGYAGWVSLEYNPEGPTEEGFGYLRERGLLGG